MVSTGFQVQSLILSGPQLLGVSLGRLDQDLQLAQIRLFACLDIERHLRYNAGNVEEVRKHRTTTGRSEACPTRRRPRRRLSRSIWRSSSSHMFRMERERYKAVQAHAEAHNESVNSFINWAVDEAMKREEKKPMVVDRARKEGNAFYDSFWGYYINIEKRFIDTERYVSFGPRNGEAYSVEFNSLLQLTCSQLDTVFRHLVSCGNTGHRVDEDYSMGKYFDLITTHYPDFPDRSIRSIILNTMLTPWDSWKSQPPKNSPVWWRAYISTKHGHKDMLDADEKETYMLANQKNVILSLAGLYQAEMYLFRETVHSDGSSFPDVPGPGSELFQIEDWGNKWVMQTRTIGFKRAYT